MYVWVDSTLWLQARTGGNCWREILVFNVSNVYIGEKWSGRLFHFCRLYHAGRQVGNNASYFLSLLYINTYHDGIAVQRCSLADGVSAETVNPSEIRPICRLYMTFVQHPCSLRCLVDFVRSHPDDIISSWELIGIKRNRAYYAYAALTTPVPNHWWLSRMIHTTSRVERIAWEDRRVFVIAHETYQLYKKLGRVLTLDRYSVWQRRLEQVLSLCNEYYRYMDALEPQVGPYSIQQCLCGFFI